jgi:hypothetical protein
MNERTLLQLFKTLKGDLELIRRVEGGGVIFNLDAKKRNDRHLIRGWYEISDY